MASGQRVGHGCSENFEKRARSAAKGAMMLEWRSAEHGLVRSARYRGVSRPDFEVAKRGCWEECSFAHAVRAWGGRTVAEAWSPPLDVENRANKSCDADSSALGTVDASRKRVLC